MQYELTFTNILTMLDPGGIPIRSSDRDDDCLLVAAVTGGISAGTDRASIDAFLIGDGEGHFHKVVDHWKSSRNWVFPEEIARSRSVGSTEFMCRRYTVLGWSRHRFTVVDSPPG